MRIRLQARNRTIVIRDGRIADAGEPFDLSLTFPDADVRPGLINAHDHLHRNHYGRLGRPPYPDAHHWAYDIQARHRQPIALGRLLPRREALLGGAWKNLFSGVTTVVHHDPWEPDFDDDFPLRVARVRNADSIGMTVDLGGLALGGPYCLHVAEGESVAARSELRRLAEIGLLTADLIAVHAVGMDDAAVERFRASGAAVVWCPTSNLFLFGATAPAELLREGVDVLLGTDFRLTGDGDLLDELKSARRCGLLNDERLEAAVGQTAARRLGLAFPSLTPGAVADVVVMSKPILEASAHDVQLVMVGGVPQVASPDLAASLSRLVGRGEVVKIGSMVRWVNRPLAPRAAMGSMQ